MTAWKDRALAAEQRLAECSRQLELYYHLVSTEEAIAALRSLKALLGVSSAKSAGVQASVTRTVEYVELAK